MQKVRERERLWKKKRRSQLKAQKTLLEEKKMKEIVGKEALLRYHKKYMKRLKFQERKKKNSADYRKRNPEKKKERYKLW